MSQARPLAPTRRGRLLLSVALLATLCGCRTGGTGALARWRMAYDKSLATPPTDTPGPTDHAVNPEGGTYGFQL